MAAQQSLTRGMIEVTIYENSVDETVVSSEMHIVELDKCIKVKEIVNLRTPICFSSDKAKWRAHGNDKARLHLIIQQTIDTQAATIERTVCAVERGEFAI